MEKLLKKATSPLVHMALLAISFVGVIGAQSPVVSEDGACDQTCITRGTNPSLVLIAKTAGVSSIAPGQTITYTIQVTNSSTVTADMVTVSDAIPNGTTLVYASQIAPAATFTVYSPTSGGGGTVTFTAPTFAAGATATFQVLVIVNTSITSGTITNVATVTGSNFAPNSAISTVPILCSTPASGCNSCSQSCGGCSVSPQYLSPCSSNCISPCSPGGYNFRTSAATTHELVH